MKTLKNHNRFLQAQHHEDNSGQSFLIQLRLVLWQANIAFVFTDPLGEGFPLSSVYCRCVLVARSCLTLCHPVGCSPPGSSVHGILQAMVLEWVAISFSRGTSQSRNWTQVSHTAGRYFTDWATWETQPRDQGWVFCMAGRFFTIWAISKPLYCKGIMKMLMKYFPSSEKK